MHKRNIAAVCGRGWSRLSEEKSFWPSAILARTVLTFKPSAVFLHWLTLGDCSIVNRSKHQPRTWPTPSPILATHDWVASPGTRHSTARTAHHRPSSAMDMRHDQRPRSAHSNCDSGGVYKRGKPQWRRSWLSFRQRHLRQLLRPCSSLMRMVEEPDFASKAEKMRWLPAQRRQL